MGITYQSSRSLSLVVVPDLRFRYQLDWIKEYLNLRSGTATSDSDLELWYVMVSKFMLCAHLQWSIWAVIQAENSTLDFDFADYAIQRIGEYKRWKKLIAV